MEKEKCPLCEVSPQTIEELKKTKKEERGANKKVFRFSGWKIFLFLTFLLVVVIFIFTRVYFKNYSGQGAETGAPLISEIPKIGHYPAPDFSLKDIEGIEVSLSSLLGNNLLLVFWTTWCGWCTKEKPILKEFVNDHQDKIKVIGINIREEKDVVKKHIEELQLNFPTLLDETGEVSKSYNVTTHPSHFLIDKEGRVRAVRPGFSSREDLDFLAQILLEE